jgi:hypothetical protein
MEKVWKTAALNLMKITIAAIVNSLCILPLSANATTVATESFDYSGPILNGNGGAGFSGAWSTVPATADVNLSNDNVSLQYPSGTALIPSGDRVREYSDGGTSTFGGLATRTMDTTFDANSESALYFSFLVNKVQASSSVFSVNFLDASNVKFFSAGAGSGSSLPRIGRNSSTTGGDIGATEAATSLESGSTYMFLGKVNFHSGTTPDEYYLSWLKVGTDSVPASEPVSWMLSRTHEVVSLSGNTLRLDFGNGAIGTSTQLDELRLGTTYASVALGLTGDFNNDGSVDAADYIVWRKNDGSQTGFDLWRANFGNTIGSGAAIHFGQSGVPEPASWFIAGVFLSAAGVCRCGVKQCR